MKILSLLISLWLSGLFCSVSQASEVEIVSAVALRQGSQWQFRVTLRHADSGWDHYADRWRILDPQGKVLGERILYHPHEHEQPFTRSLSGVIVPEGVGWVQIEAQDTVDGWAAERYRLSIENNNPQ